MKFAVRALVFGMLVTGFAADYMITSSTQNSKTVIAAASFMPVPTCAPGSGGCGMGGGKRSR